MVIRGYQTALIRQLAQQVPDTVVLRWGGPRIAGAVNGQAQLVSGLAQLEKLHAAGVRVPEYTRECPIGPGWFGRRNNHTQGRDIRVQRERGYPASDYWTKIIEDVLSEWRIHVLHRRVIARGTKHYVGAGEPGIIRSRRLGWHIRHDVEPPRGVRNAGRAACAALGYDLGAVDLLVTSTGVVVLEVNSRPALRDPYTLTQYTNALSAL